LVGQPIEPLVNPNGDRATLEVKVGKERIPISLVHSCNTIAEARPEQDPLEEAVNISQEEQTWPILEEDISHFVQETDPDDKSVRPGAAGLLIGIERSRLRDSSWMYLTSFVTTQIGVELAAV